MCVFSSALVVTYMTHVISHHHIQLLLLIHLTSTKVMHKERAEKQKSLFAPPRKEGSERSIDSHSHSLASRSPPASPVRVGGTSLAAAAAGGGLSSLSARLDSPGGGRPRLQLAPRTKPLPKLEIKKVVPANDDNDDDAGAVAADQNTANHGHQNDASDDGKQGGSDKGNAPMPSEPGEMKILARPKDQKKEDDKTGKDKDSKGKVIDVAASKRLISGALGGLGGKSGKGGAKSAGGARVVGETEVVSAPDGTVSYRITIGGDDDDDDHDHDDESASSSSSTGPNRSRGNRRGRGRGGGGRGGRGGRTHGGRGRGRTGGGGRGRGGDGEEKSKASKSEKKQQHRAPSRFEKQSDGSVKLYKGKSSKGGKGGASGNTKQTGSKQSSLSAAASKGGKK